jgi:hypothetical protein
MHQGQRASAAWALAKKRHRKGGPGVGGTAGDVAAARSLIPPRPTAEGGKMKTAHCQICGRDIQSASGLIAHHGYHRPGGWQTPSCPGARHLPYEISCDMLPPTINEGVRYLAKVRDALANLLTNPPESYPGVHRGQSYTVTRPVDFDPHHPRGAGIPRSYAAHYARERVPLEDDMRATQANLDYLRHRLADWRAPEEAARQMGSLPGEPDQRVIIPAALSTVAPPSSASAVRVIALGGVGVPAGASLGYGASRRPARASAAPVPLPRGGDGLGLLARPVIVGDGFS